MHARLVQLVQLILKFDFPALICMSVRLHLSRVPSYVSEVDNHMVRLRVEHFSSVPSLEVASSIVLVTFGDATRVLPESIAENNSRPSCKCSAASHSQLCVGTQQFLSNPTCKYVPSYTYVCFHSKVGMFLFAIFIYLFICHLSHALRYVIALLCHVCAQSWGGHSCSYG